MKFSPTIPLTFMIFLRRSVIVFTFLFSVFAWAAQPYQSIISFNPDVTALSTHQDFVSSWGNKREIEVISPAKLGIEERYLLKYALYVGEYKGISCPFYLWKEGRSTFPGECQSDIQKEFEKKIQEEATLFNLKPQAFIYEVKEGAKSSFLMVGLKRWKDQIIVNIFSNTLSQLVFEFSFPQAGSKALFQEKLVAGIIKEVLKKDLSNQKIIFDLKEVQKATLARYTEVNLSSQKNKTISRALYSFLYADKMKGLVIEGNPDIGALITHLQDGVREIVLDRHIIGDEKDIEEYLNTKVVDETIIRNEKDLRKQFERTNAMGTAHKKFEFLKQDLGVAVVTADDEAISRLVDSLLQFFDNKISWDQMPNNLKTKEDLVANIKEIIEEAKRLHIPDVVLLQIAETLINPKDAKSPLQLSGYLSIKTPDHYLLLKKEIKLSELFPSYLKEVIDQIGASSAMEFYYGSIEGKIGYWMQLSGVES